MKQWNLLSFEHCACTCISKNKNTSGKKNHDYFGWMYNFPLLNSVPAELEDLWLQLVVITMIPPACLLCVTNFQHTTRTDFSWSSVKRRSFLQWDSKSLNYWVRKQNYMNLYKKKFSIQRFCNIQGFFLSKPFLVACASQFKIHNSQLGKCHIMVCHRKIVYM